VTTAYMTNGDASIYNDAAYSLLKGSFSPGEIAYILGYIGTSLLLVDAFIEITLYDDAWNVVDIVNSAYIDLDDLNTDQIFPGSLVLDTTGLSPGNYGIEFAIYHADLYNTAYYFYIQIAVAASASPRVTTLSATIYKEV
jgi:hypothetical protein